MSSECVVSVVSVACPPSHGRLYSPVTELAVVTVLSRDDSERGYSESMTLYIMFTVFIAQKRLKRWMCFKLNMLMTDVTIIQ